MYPIQRLKHFHGRIALTQACPHGQGCSTRGAQATGSTSYGRGRGLLTLASPLEGLRLHCGRVNKLWAWERLAHARWRGSGYTVAGSTSYGRGRGLLTLASPLEGLRLHCGRVNKLWAWERLAHARFTPGIPIAIATVILLPLLEWYYL